MKSSNGFDWVALAVLVIGGINWGLIGAFNIDIVSSLFGEMTILTRVIFSLVGLSALYIAFTTMTYTNESTTRNHTRVVHQ
jgi:hypothetical protein